MTNKHELLTINEAAEVTRAPVATLRYWRHLGVGPRSFRLGRRVVYLRNDVESWIEAQADAASTGWLSPTADSAPTGARTSSLARYQETRHFGQREKV
jgi:predicted DNA-binding transcriptional regulator AlpA